jgi:hypothetical protein
MIQKYYYLALIKLQVHQLTILISIPAITAILTASSGVSASLSRVCNRTISSQSETVNPIGKIICIQKFKLKDD